jgi:hypothetical protein
VRMLEQYILPLFPCDAPHLWKKCPSVFN